MKKKHFMQLYLTASLFLLFLLPSCGNAANEPPASETPLGEVASGKDSRPTESPEPSETPEPTEEVGTEEKFEPLPWIHMHYRTAGQREQRRSSSAGMQGSWQKNPMLIVPLIHIMDHVCMMPPW